MRLRSRRDGSLQRATERKDTRDTGKRRHGGLVFLRLGWSFHGCILGGVTLLSQLAFEAEGTRSAFILHILSVPCKDAWAVIRHCFVQMNSTKITTIKHIVLDLITLNSLWNSQLTWQILLHVYSPRARHMDLISTSLISTTLHSSRLRSSSLISSTLIHLSRHLSALT